MGIIIQSSTMNTSNNTEPVKPGGAKTNQVVKIGGARKPTEELSEIVSKNRVGPMSLMDDGVKGKNDEKLKVGIVKADPKKDSKSSGKKKGEPEEDVSITFPQRLMEILSKEEHFEIISWLPHGKGFMIHKKQKFETDVMPHYFHKHSKYTSFTRKLNRWGFVRVTRGPEMGAYYHKFFKRGENRLCMQMSCQRPSGVMGAEAFNSTEIQTGGGAQAFPNQQMVIPGGMQQHHQGQFNGVATGAGAGAAGHHPANLLQLQQQQQHFQLLMRQREQMIQRGAMMNWAGQGTPGGSQNYMMPHMMMGQMCSPAGPTMGQQQQLHQHQQQSHQQQMLGMNPHMMMRMENAPVPAGNPVRQQVHPAGGQVTGMMMMSGMMGTNINPGLGGQQHPQNRM